MDFKNVIATGVILNSILCSIKAINLVYVWCMYVFVMVHSCFFVN